MRGCLEENSNSLKRLRCTIVSGLSIIYLSNSKPVGECLKVGLNKHPNIKLFEIRLPC